MNPAVFSIWLDRHVVYYPMAGSRSLNKIPRCESALQLSLFSPPAFAGAFPGSRPISPFTIRSSGLSTSSHIRQPIAMPYATMAPYVLPRKRRHDYDLRLLPNRVLAELEQGVTCEQEAVARSGLTIGYPAWNLFYYTTLCSLRPDNYNLIVEIGTNWGCSTICLAQAFSDSGYAGRVHAVDISETNLSRAREHIGRSGLWDLIEIHCQDSLEFLSKLPWSRRSDQRCVSGWLPLPGSLDQRVYTYSPAPGFAFDCVLR